MPVNPSQVSNILANILKATLFRYIQPYVTNLL